MNKEIYDSLETRDKAFVDLLIEISISLRRLADLMDRSLADE